MSKATQAIHNHHQKLSRTFSDLAAAVAAAGERANPDELIHFLKTDLLPHAIGEERHLYPLIDSLIKAHGKGTATMSVDHDFIQNYVRRIDDTARAMRTAVPADRQRLAGELQRLVVQLQALLEVHLEKEERVYLPLLEHHSSESQQQRALERMHATYQEEKGAGGEAAAAAEVKTSLDVREVPPPRRHPLIFETFDSLKRGEAFILINDHDPKPLYYQFGFEREGQFSWDYLEQGPKTWRVRIGRTQRTP